MPTMLENGEPVELDEDDTTTVECYDCGDEVDEDTTTEIDGDPRCESCADDYQTCDDCEEWVTSGYLNSVEDGDKAVCDSCSYDYSTCESCSTSVHNDSTISVGYDGICCHSCYENGYAEYCDHCGEYYWEGNGPCCNLDCHCESPKQSFGMPSNGGSDTVSQDERVEITLAAGIISTEGLHKISSLVRSEGNRIFREMREAIEADGTNIYDLPGDHEIHTVRNGWNSLSSDVCHSDALGNEWQGQRGNYTRRLRRHAHQNYKISLPDSLITEVGNVARAQSMGTDVAVEFTRDLNQSADDFYHSESCWWSDYSESRCSLKNNGGIGMRSFGEVTRPKYGYQYGPWRHGLGQAYVEMGTETRHEVTGRAWVMPLNLGEEFDQRWYDYNAGEWTTRKMRRWEPTFDSTTPDAYIVFNGYGALSDYAPARIMAEMTGLTYRKIGFECAPMYVNNGGYIVTSKEILDSLGDDDAHISLSTDAHSNLYSRELTHAA